MEFEYTDNRKWTYVFSIDEKDLMFVHIQSKDDTGKLVHMEDIAFFEDVFNWRPYHTRGDHPLISKEARDYCEKCITRYMKLKVFW